MKHKYEKERQQLINDIITLVEKGDTVDGLTVKMQWKMRLDTEKALINGEYKQNDNQSSGLCGILNSFLTVSIGVCCRFNSTNLTRKNKTYED